MFVFMFVFLFCCGYLLVDDRFLIFMFEFLVFVCSCCNILIIFFGKIFFGVVEVVGFFVVFVVFFWVWVWVGVCGLGKVVGLLVGIGILCEVCLCLWRVIREG